jgi:hypothetical protein
LNNNTTGTITDEMTTIILLFLKAFFDH